MTDKLLPCPFCGGTPTLTGRASMPTGRKLWFQCANCETSGPAYWDRETNPLTNGAPDEALALWNKRGIPPVDHVAGWQPIETAPRGTEILVWNGRRRHVAHWDRVEGAWVSSFRTTTKRLEVTPAPTHWQPLADGPAAATEADHA